MLLFAGVRGFNIGGGQMYADTPAQSTASGIGFVSQRQHSAHAQLLTFGTVPQPPRKVHREFAVIAAGHGPYSELLVICDVFRILIFNSVPDYALVGAVMQILAGSLPRLIARMTGDQCVHNGRRGIEGIPHTMHFAV